MAWRRDNRGRGEARHRRLARHQDSYLKLANQLLRVSSSNLLSQFVRSTLYFFDITFRSVFYLDLFHVGDNLFFPTRLLFGCFFYGWRC